MVSKGLVCLYILEKVDIWSGDTDASQTDRQTTEYRATQLLSSIQFKLSHVITFLTQERLHSGGRELSNISRRRKSGDPPISSSSPTTSEEEVLDPAPPHNPILSDCPCGILLLSSLVSWQYKVRSQGGLKARLGAKFVLFSVTN